VALKSVNWDVQLAVSFPFFQGGLVSAQVREAQALSHQWSLQLSEVRRKAEQEVRTFYQALVMDQKQTQKLSALVEVSRKNYEVQSQVYQNGLVTNLDVLQALSTYRVAIRQLDQMKRTYALDSVKLQAAIGKREEIPTQ
jgi:outer membrane protein